MASKIKYVLLIGVMLAAFMLNVSAATVAYTDLQGSVYENDVKLLTALQILPQYPDGLFKPDENITRAEVADIMLRLAGYKDIPKSSGDSVFKDVNDNSVYADSIKTACALGIISGNGSGSFQPEGTVSYQEAVKMIVCVLGYKSYAELHGGYPEGYFSIAVDKGVTGSVNLIASEKVTRGTLSKLLYNALDAEILTVNSRSGQEIQYSYSDNKTLLSEKHKVQKSKGIVTANYYTSLIGASTLVKGNVEIDWKSYRMRDVDVSGYLGERVIYYFKDSEDTSEKVLLYVERDLKNNDVLKLKASNIEAYKEYKYEYYPESTTDSAANIRTARLSSGSAFIINGTAMLAYDPLKLDPSSGEVTLIDNNSDGIYDVAKVDSYENIAVKTLNEEEQVIVDMYKSENNLYLKKDDIDIEWEMKDVQGKNISIKDLTEYQTLSVYKSLILNHKQYIKCIVSDDIAGGMVEEIDVNDKHKTVVLDGQKLNIASNYDMETDNKLKIGDSVTLHLDFEGNVASVEIDEIGLGRYGYIVLAGTDKTGLKKKAKFKLYSSYGAMISIACANNVQIDGEMYKDGEEILKKFQDADGATINQVIKYTIDSEKNINWIDTALDNEDFHISYAYDQSKTLKYIYNTRSFQGVVNLNDSTIVFLIPDDKTDEKSFQVISATQLVGDELLSVEAYNSEEDDPIADVLVVYNRSFKQLDKTVNLTLVKNITTVLNNDGKMVNRLEGIENGKNVVVTTKDLTVFPSLGIREGDTIRYVSDRNNEILDMEKVFDSVTYAFLSSANPSAAYTDMYRTIYGNVYQKYENMIGVTVKDPLQASKGDIEYHVGDKFYIYIYDKEKKKVRVGTLDDICDFKNYGSKYSKVLIQTYYGQPRTLIIYK